VHVDARITIPLAIMLAAAIVGYWWYLGRPSVPRGRRIWRRVSLTLMLLSLPAFIRGLSYLDPAIDADKQQYVIAWSTALLLVLMTFLTACVDVFISMHIHRGQYEQEIAQAGRELREAVRRQQAADEAASGPRADTGNRSGGPPKEQSS
jgi:hypothetical protein